MSEAMNQGKSKTPPKVSIGMPVFNGEPFIREALDSLLAQTFTNFELIISDNASTDGTEAICREYAACDTRIRYVRQPENRGGLFNFQFVLDEARGEYFMWAAHDDLWGTGFVEENAEFLDDHIDYVASISASMNDRGEKGNRAGSTIIDDKDAEDRIRRFFKNPASNSRFYSLLRKKTISDLKLNEFNYVAGDWSIIIFILNRGKFNAFDGEVGFTKRPGISCDTIKFFDAYRLNPIEFLFPYYYYSKYLLNKTKLFKQRKDILLFLLSLNFGGAKAYHRARLGRFLRYIIATLHLEEGLIIPDNLNLRSRLKISIKYIPARMKRKIFKIGKYLSYRGIYLFNLRYIKRLLKIDVHYRKGVRCPIPIDVIIPTAMKDFDSLSMVVNGARINIKHPINKIFIVAPNKTEFRRFCLVNDFVFIDELSILGYDKNSISYVVGGYDRSGWLFQQLLKLSADKISSNQFILILDADTVFVRPKIFLYKGKMIFDQSTERHEAYHDVYKKLLNRRTTSPLSFVTHYMLFERSKLQALKSTIEKIHGIDWDKAILKNVDYNNISGFSEYETFGNFVLSEYPSDVIREYWFNMSGVTASKQPYYAKSISFHKYSKI